MLNREANLFEVRFLRYGVASVAIGWLIDNCKL